MPNIITIGKKIISVGLQPLRIDLSLPNPYWSTFTDIADIYNSLQPDDKVAFIIRHSERDDIEGSHQLTPVGIQYAKDVGDKITGTALADITFYSSTKQRCLDTAKYIAEGMGYTIQESDITTDQLISDCPYVITAPSSGWEDYSYYAYDLPTTQGTWKNKYTITNQIFDFVTNRMNKKMNIFITHDQLLEIFVVDKCNQEIGLRFWEGAINDGQTDQGHGRWITYLAGLAIIKHSDGTFDWMPVRGLDRGYQRSYSNIYIDG